MRVHATPLRHALWVLFTSSALVVVGVLLSRGDERAPERVVLFAQFMHGLVSMMAGMVFYLAWRFGGTPALGWVSAAVLFSGLHSFPFVLTAFADPGIDTARESMEIPVAVGVTVLLVFAAQGVTRGLRPLAVGMLMAVGAVALRLLLLGTHPLPADWSSGTAWLERGLVVVLTAASFGCVLRSALGSRVRTALGFVVLMTGLVGLTSTATSTPGGQASALAVATLVMLAGVLLLDGSIRAIIDALEAHQHEMETLARAALRAEAEANREQELLHEVRSTVGGLATASQLLSLREGLSEAHRETLQRAMSEELLRVNRSVVGTLAQVQEFPLRMLLEPILEFHRADGREITLAALDEGVTVAHVPDAVAQVVGTLLHNAGRHAPGRALTVSARVHERTVLVLVSQPGPAIDPSVRTTLFGRGARSTTSPGQGLGLNVARRLMREHHGDLDLTASSDTLTTFTISLPLGVDAEVAR